MAKKAKCPKCEAGAPAYMLTYGDMVTLLMTFFVLLFSFAEVDGRTFRLVLSSFRGSLGIFTGGTSLSKGRLEEMGMTIDSLPSTQRGTALSKSYREAVSLFQPEIKHRKIKIQEDERGIIITLLNDAYFAPGSAVISQDLQKTLVKLAKLIRPIPSFVRIEGHTDNQPIPITGVREGYETNWELSGARSINILRFLIETEDINEKKMSAVAFGATRPLYPNDTPERRSFNRRVDVVILRKLYKENRKHMNLPDNPIPDEEWTIPDR